MKLFQYSNITAVFPVLITALLFFGFASAASAQEIDVDFGAGALFNEAEFLPGDAEVRTFTVENLSDSEKDVRLRTLNESDTGLAEALLIEIERTAGTEYFNDTLRELFDLNFISLGTLQSGEEAEYTVSATFIPSSGNDYQEAGAGFVFCVGFAGDNENCVTDTTPGGVGGDGDGDGGGGPKITLVDDGDDNGDDEGPEGLVAGESTSVPPTTTILNNPVTRPFIDFMRGVVLGDTVSATTSTSTLEAMEVGEEPGGVFDNTSGLAVETGLLDGINCTFVWLLMLVVISLVWSYIDDFVKNKTAFFRFFLRNAIFSGAYVAGLVLFLLSGLLESFWWVFAAAWTIMTALDYAAHTFAEVFWSGRARNIFFGSCGLVCMLIGYFSDLLCVWIPFLIILLVSAMLAFLDR